MLSVNMDQFEQVTAMPDCVPALRPSAALRAQSCPPAPGQRHEPCATGLL
eukprot:NODE_31705_length_391_cov_1.628788.p4 GENE.NODE_31705_length_391_cov_1.628788~~NODE_31705_length_391_cov_1.628788.p4  ORF type:complete len:50 (-),score=4.75 NODE_31705_length_391_cov_1.628788:39-188(-)